MRRALALVMEDSDEDEFVVRRPRLIREREEHVDVFDDRDFITRFPLTKPTVPSILESIEDKLEFTRNMVHAHPAAANRSISRPVIESRDSLTQMKLFTLIDAKMQAEEQHKVQMRILQEQLEQEQLKTQQEQLKLEMVKLKELK